MKNPLYRRLPRELKDEIGKYLVIFLFMVATIGFVSGFLVADHSMRIAYDDSFTDYNIEDGHFILDEEMSDGLKAKLNDDGEEIYSLFYKEEKSGDYTVRIYRNRTEVNKVCLMEGEMPKADNDIAIDRLFGENNGIDIGDTLSIDGSTYRVSGYVAFSDYSALFKSNTDMMFDAQNFTVSIMTDTAFDSVTDVHIKYQYSWKYTDTDMTDEEKYDRSQSLMRLIAQNAVMNDFVTEQESQAIHFTGDDMGGDESMMIMLLYIVIVIMAFVFAVTTTNTIEKEATVIGTLRASGYTRGELLRHYLALPVIVTLIGAVIGNILGYTVFKDVVVGMYYGSYSLPTYTTIWSPYAFVMTTVLPIIIMLIVNIFIITGKLKLSPLKFLRRDLRKNKNKKAVRLPEFKFMTRFRLRIILQNMSGYVILFIGILFASVIMLFGLMMTPLLQHYKDDVIDNMVCDYQYILKTQAETATEGAEKYAANTLETTFEDREAQDEVTVYGINQASAYFKMKLNNAKESSGVYEGITVSGSILNKYGLKVGDTIKLKVKYKDEEYSFKIAASYDYPGSLAVFLNIDDFRAIFEKEADYFNGYLSDKEITDIDEKAILTTITQSDMTILADQLFDSMGNMFPMITAFSVLMYMLLVYLLSKIIIEKNSIPVSIVKILGYQNGEVSRLYIVSTAIVVTISILISLPLSNLIIKNIYVVIMSSFSGSGWVDYYIAPQLFLYMFLMGIAAYAVVGALQFRKVSKIPMDEALKNAE